MMKSRLRPRRDDTASQIPPTRHDHNNHNRKKRIPLDDDDDRWPLSTTLVRRWWRRRPHVVLLGSALLFAVVAFLTTATVVHRNHQQHHYYHDNDNDNKNDDESLRFQAADRRLVRQLQELAAESSSSLYPTDAHDKDPSAGDDTRQRQPREDDDDEDRPQSLDRYSDDDDGIAVGVLSRRPLGFFRRIQRRIDDPTEDAARCRRYGFGTTTIPSPRRVFFGALLADEPWEVLEIVATEAYGILSGVVFVESNRTQNFTPRRVLRRGRHETTLSRLFGIPRNATSVRAYVNEASWNRTMWREHDQREEILRGWRALGMTRHDVAYLGDADETFTRDFLRAAQRCRDVPAALRYDASRCHHRRDRVAAAARMFFSSPECVSRDDHLLAHPDVTLAACVEGVGDPTVHPAAPRVDRYRRAPGYGYGCRDRDDETAAAGPDAGVLWNAADFRVNPCGTGQVKIDASAHPDLGVHTGFHFQNFFADADALRFKYATYGHPKRDAATAHLLQLGSVGMVWQCTQNLSDAQVPWVRNRHPERRRDAFPPFEPVYFHDADYRRRRHEMITHMLRRHDDGSPIIHRGVPPRVMNMMNMNMNVMMTTQGGMPRHVMAGGR